MLSVELGHLADILKSTGQGKSNLTSFATEWSTKIKNAIWEHTVNPSKKTRAHNSHSAWFSARQQKHFRI